MDLWKVCDEAGDIEPLYSKSSLPVEKASLSPVEASSPPPSDRINPELPEETLMAF